MNRYFRPQLFGKTLNFVKEATLTPNSNEINGTTGLYEEQFLIKSIYYNFGHNIDVRITNLHSEAISIVLMMKTEVEFINNVSKEYPTVLTFTMLKNQ